MCFLFLAGGCFNFNSSAESNRVKENLETTPGQPEKKNRKHYPGLETVLINENTPQQIKEYVGFTISFNKDNHTPNYVAWELLGSEVAYDVSRSNNFWQDTDLEGCPAHWDYSYSGYDRGHMCPAADQKWSMEAMADCFVMANMCPQDHDLNSGAWLTLENKERQWAQRDSALIIVAGPIYLSDSKQKRIGETGVKVPDAFFKAFLAPYIETPRAIAFVFPNMKAPGNMQNYAMSIDDLEELTGYNLFSSLPDEMENKVEATYSFIEWNRSKK